MAWIAGVDGCKGGWIAAFADPENLSEPVIAVFTDFASLCGSPFAPVLVAVDMPIGLPDTIGIGGRGPEQAVRAVLGPRRSAVFSMPSRAAVYAVDRLVVGMADISASHAEACRVARATSDDGQAFSRQAFMILPKIREIDRLLRAAPALAARVVEIHPEVAFWAMNGETPLAFAKKEPAGEAQRMALLGAQGISDKALAVNPPKGAGRDDMLDALAGLVVAKHIVAGLGRPFPDPPGRDRHGLPIAIWSFASDRLPIQDTP